MLGCWDVPSRVVVRQDALKWSSAAKLWDLSRGWAWLFTPGHLASPSSSSRLP
jgi:hypothetical protein